MTKWITEFIKENHEQWEKEKLTRLAKEKERLKE